MTIEQERDMWKREAARLAESEQVSGLAIVALVDQQAEIGDKVLGIYAQVRREAEAAQESRQNLEIAALKREVERWKNYHRELRRRYRVRGRIIRATLDTLKSLSHNASP